MKKLLTCLLAGAMALSLVGCGGSGSDDSLQRIKDAGAINIGLEGDWQPFSYHNENDELVGYDVEVAKEIAKRIGVEAKITEAPWDGLLTGLSTGVYDIVVNGVDVTEERQKTFDFSDPYAYDHIDLVVKNDNSDITTFDDLKGKKTANSTGSTYAEWGTKYGAEVSNVPTLAETMELVLNGTVDATINADTSVQDYLNTTGETGLKIVAKSDEATEYAIPIKKGSYSLREAINKAIADMRSDGTLADLSKKYFGADLTEK
ncbi:MAG: transporter substrate-binding domain-containing protein [Catonella sp.]|jgi:cystine transport system substrate-binding protein|nr:transporter substrate-binding domain-containing protein [Catonella sp.]MDY6356321.1 transporter substrate-binding domain-containing protein [Catonella sp.]